MGSEALEIVENFGYIKDVYCLYIISHCDKDVVPIYPAMVGVWPRIGFIALCK